MELVVLAVQFRTVEELILSGELDLAVTVADELPRSMVRQSTGPRGAVAYRFVCFFDPRFVKLPRPLTEQSDFAQEHVAVSYAGDGIVEDATHRAAPSASSSPMLQ